MAAAAASPRSTSSQIEEQRSRPRSRARPGTKDVTIDCPDDVEAEEGGVFECDLSAEGGIEAKVEVTQEDDEGNVRWQESVPEGA